MGLSTGRHATLVLGLLFVACDAATLRAPSSCRPSPHQVQRGAINGALYLRGGATTDESATGLKALLLVLRKLIFPGNPARERAPWVPPAPPPPPPQAAAAAGGEPALNRGGKGRSRRGKGASGGGVGSVISVHSKKEFDELLAKTRGKQLIVVDFFATWCGPCQQIAPKYSAMAAAIPHVKFLKVDVDECKELSQQYGVQSMPTFKFIRGGKEVDEMKGADDNALKEKVESLAGPADRWASVGAGRTL